MQHEVPDRPDHDCLFDVASEQHGYFTIPQAQNCGISRFLLAQLHLSGRYFRVARGLYRIKNYPPYHREEIVQAWLRLGRDRAIVSHESALDLHNLSDVIPNAIHFTVPRSHRYSAKIPGVTIHTTKKPLDSSDIVVRDGINVTSIPRTIIDAAATGTGPEQIELAIRQALQRGQTTRGRLLKAVQGESRRVQNLVEHAISDAPS